MNAFYYVLFIMYCEGKHLSSSAYRFLSRASGAIHSPSFVLTSDTLNRLGCTHCKLEWGENSRTCERGSSRGRTRTRLGRLYVPSPSQFSPSHLLLSLTLCFSTPSAPGGSDSCLAKRIIFFRPVFGPARSWDGGHRVPSRCHRGSRHEVWWCVPSPRVAVSPTSPVPAGHKSWAAWDRRRNHHCPVYLPSYWSEPIVRHLPSTP